MQRRWLLAPVLLFALAWFVWYAVREAPSSSLTAPDAESVATRDPGPALLDAHDDALGAQEPSPVTARESLDAGSPLFGVLRDRNTDKPIPEVRVAVTHGEHQEVLQTDLDGRFRTSADLLAGLIEVDPTPFPEDFADWYSRAKGVPIQVEHDPTRDELVALTVDAPPYVIVDGLDGLQAPLDRVRTCVVLPGAEQPGPNGTTWVESEHRRLGVHPRRLADGSLLISTSALEPRPNEPPHSGSGEAHVEVSSWDLDCRWWRSDALSISAGHLFDERIVVHDRSECAALHLRFDGVDDLPTDGVELTFTPLAAAHSIEAPAIWRSFPEWAELLNAAAGEPLLSTLTDAQAGDEPEPWTSSCLPGGDYELVVRHPRYESLERRIRLEPGTIHVTSLELEPAPIGAPIRIRAEWEDPGGILGPLRWQLTRLDDDGSVFAPLGMPTRLGEHGHGTWKSEPILDPVEIEGLPEGRYRVQIAYNTRFKPARWPLDCEPLTPTVASGEPVEFVIRNAGLARWTFSRAERPRDERPSLRTSYVIEWFDPDGASIEKLYLSEPQLLDSQLIAPTGSGWRFELRERGLGENRLRHSGPWRADEVRNEGSREVHHIVLK